MTSEANTLSSEERLRIITDALDDKKAIDLESITLGEESLMADYFVLATSTSRVHMRALADGVAEAMRDRAGQRARREGENDSDWVLLDYGDVVVHVFSQEARAHYDLDSLWRATAEQRSAES